MSEREMEENERDSERDDELVAYLDGELEPERMALVEERLSNDPAYRARLQELERVWSALDDLPTGEPTAVFVKSTLELVVNDIRKEQSRLQKRSTLYWASALVLAVVPFLCLFVSFLLTQYWRTADQRAFLNDLEVIENFEMYGKVDRDIQFLEILDHNGLFVGEVNSDNR